MRRIALTVLGTALVVTGVRARAAELTPDARVREAIASVKREPSWEEIRIDKTTDQGGTFTLVYKKSPSEPSRAVVERDTAAIGRAVLKALVAAGRPPKDASIWVWALMPGSAGESGQQRVRPYGGVHYDPAPDAFVYQPFTMP
jgi:hypothetical protein